MSAPTRWVPPATAFTEPEGLPAGTLREERYWEAGYATGLKVHHWRQVWQAALIGALSGGMLVAAVAALVVFTWL